MRVTFFMPEKYLPDRAGRDAWESGAIRNLEESGKIACAQSWIYQTWAALSATGCDCVLSHEIPDEGIVVALSGFFGDSQRFSPEVFFVDIVADFLPHPGAQLHIVQNRAHAGRLPRSVFMPHWPHPNLVPREPSRKDTFENVCFLGHPENLARELRSPEWVSSLASDLGLKFEIRRADRWHDYSDVDCALAIRDFTKSRQLHKPATKLYNAWLAEVPFIGGRDSAYAADGHAGKDYLQAESPDEVLVHLRKLKEDAQSRARLLKEGKKSGNEFTREKTLGRWCLLVNETLPAAASKHTSLLPAIRAINGIVSRVSVFLDRRVR